MTDADWMSLRNGLHLIVVELDSCSFTRTCNTLFSESCDYNPMLCRLNVLSCLLAPSYQLVGLAPAATKCFCATNCIRCTSRELLSQWRPQFEDAGCALRRPHTCASGHQVSELLLNVTAFSTNIPAFGGCCCEAALKERLPSARYSSYKHLVAAATQSH